MKTLFLMIVATAFLLSSTMVLAANVRCTVDSVEGDKVVVTCAKADTLKGGQKVVVKSKKRVAYEGC